MEPDIMPLHSSSPPPLNDDGDGEVGSEEDEFGDFSVGVSCSPLGFADARQSPSSLRQASLTIKPATHQYNCSFNHPIEQSQPTSTVNFESSRGQMDLDGLDSNAGSSLHLTNGCAERGPNSGAHSVVGGCSPKEETGFADFTVFTGHGAHPWCCGFSPMGNTEQWNGRVGGTNNSLSEQICDSGQEVIMESEPRSHFGHKAKESVCTKVKHCERRDAALVQSSQDHLQPQAAAAALNFPSGEEELEKPWEMRRSFNFLQTSEVQEDGKAEDQEKSFSTIPQTFSMCEVASEDLPSFSDDLSFEGASADLEPNVSSLASEDDPTDWDGTDDDDDEQELENYRHSDSFVNSSMADLSQSELQKGFNHSNQHETQDTCATSNQPQSEANTEDKFSDFTESSLKRHRDQDHVQMADADMLSLGNLPPSDSFADFCSAPTQGDGDGLWAEFKDQSAEVEGKTWTQFREPVSSLQADGDTKEEQDRAGQYGGSRRNSSQASLSCRVQQLLQTSFPEVMVPPVEGEEELLSLSALLQTEHLPDSEEAIPDLSNAQRIQQDMLWGYQDVHDAVGLQFQWGGSHINRTLLSCLGVDTRNIVFMGAKKQPVTVPAFASGMGLLEPTKDSVPAVCSPRHTAVTAQAPPGSRDVSNHSTHSVQEELPSSQLNWSNHGLSSSQDGCSALNLDYFGSDKESRSSNSSSSRSNSPPPGVDRELYELSLGKLETSINISHLEDTLNHLMSTAKRTSISVRKPLQDEELSAQAGRVIAGLPNLSFMQARVLMFPSILLPKACGSPK